MNVKNAARGMAAVALLCMAGVAGAEGKANRGSEPPDFPPGDFSDGNHYSLADFHGKVVVLFFYEDSCPTCRGTIPDRNKLVQKYKDKPIKFVAVGPHDSLADVKDYIAGTGLVMPTFADPFRVMEKRYGFAISLQNIYQFRVIDPKGVLVGYVGADELLDRALEGAHWTFKDGNYHAKLAAVVDALEWNQWGKAIPALKLAMKSSDAEVKASAIKLYEEVKKVGQQWKEEAEKAAEAEPIKAFDLYHRVSQVFEGEELGKSVAEPLKGLQKNKDVAAELEARKMYGQLEAAMAKATAAQKNDVLAFCKKLVLKYPDTPTGKKVQQYVDDLGAEASGG